MFYDVLLVVHDVLRVFHDVPQCFTVLRCFMSVSQCFMSVSRCLTMFYMFCESLMIDIGACLHYLQSLHGRSQSTVAEIRDNATKVIPC